MRTVEVNLADLDKTVLDVGYVGEKNHVKVIIRCPFFFQKYPDATAYMTMNPPVGDMYPLNPTISGSNLVWNVSEADIAYAGNGSFQITFTQDNEIIKTVIGNYTVNASYQGEGDPPSPIDDWIARAGEAIAEVPQQVAAATSAWLDENVDPETGYVLDKTLTIEGAAADANAVGYKKAPAIDEAISTPADVMTFADGADGVPMQVQVGIDPVQDLHGYDHPWPAGGGKNL